jgi:heat shock protein HslJ
MRFRPWFVWLLVLAGVSACADGAAETEPIGSQPTTTVTTEPSQKTLKPPPDVVLVVGTGAGGFADVETALATAMKRWETSGPDTYAYRVTIDCDCSDAGESWVRVFDRQLPEPPAWNVDALFERISATLGQSSTRIEVAFDADLGTPIWFATEGDTPETILIDEFHDITRTATPFDGEWRFVGGEFSGSEFGNPTSGLIVFTLQDGSFDYPHDCNRAGGPVDIHGSHFGSEPALTFTTLVGCPEYSQEADLFAEALFASTTIEQQGSRLVLSGENSVLEFKALQEPDLRGELPLTAAGETLTIDAAGRDLASVFTISSRTEGNPARWIVYTLIAATTGSNQTPT